MKRIITIGREFGSGGHEIAQNISNILGIKLYDKEFIDDIALKNNVSKSIIEHYDESPTEKSLFKYKTNAIEIIDKEMPIEKQVFIAEKHYMLELASKEDCIFVGRCANNIFRKYDKLISFFINSPLNKRIERKMTQLGLEYDEVKKLILQTDKSRAKYYKEYTGDIWGSPNNYNFCINSGQLGIEKTSNIIANIIIDYYK